MDILDREYRGQTAEVPTDQQAEVAVAIEQVGRPVSMLRAVRLYVLGQPTEVLDLRITCAVEKLSEPDVVVQEPMNNASIQRALDSLGDAGGVVYLPAGVYE